MRGPAAELAARFSSEPPKGEITLVVGPAAAARQADEADALAAVAELTAAGPPSAAGCRARLGA